jgi:hypothetical protein
MINSLVVLLITQVLLVLYIAHPEVNGLFLICALAFNAIHMLILMGAVLRAKIKMKKK